MTGLRTRTSREGAVADLEVDAVFAYVGLQPNTAVLQDRLSLDLAGQIPTDGWMRSELAGVCAAGTVRGRSPYRAVSAAGDGASAAVAVDRYRPGWSVASRIVESENTAEGHAGLCGLL